MTVPSELSNTSSTVALPTGFRPVEPEKMTSLSASPRNRLAALSPITQRIASMMLDLPQPFGPTMPVMLVGKCRTVGSTKDLKPDSLIVVSRIVQRISRSSNEPLCNNFGVVGGGGFRYRGGRSQEAAVQDLNDYRCQ